ncbi:MAG TPA: hypothetical protein VKV73_14275 [Chloroflexota bacterium]|nr:hypothetical protein [Chloroflexota bacterium]
MDYLELARTKLQTVRVAASAAADDPSHPNTPCEIREKSEKRGSAREAAEVECMRLGEQIDGAYAPLLSCPGCELRLWWQRPDGGWECGVCTPDPVKCRQCDRPHYSHLAWPMVCERWEPLA